MKQRFILGLQIQTIMLSRISKKILTTLLFCFLLNFLQAQSHPEETAVKACLENYMSGVGDRVEKAFHPTAFMKYIDINTGEFKDVPIAEYIARVKAGSGPGKRTIGIESLNIESTAANAKIKIETDTVILYDYMNMLKINGEWKIVSKIFSRVNK
ncbi:MAG: nuclear transport factor 2 family protein [Sediminibacterium sp.]